MKKILALLTVFVLLFAGTVSCFGAPFACAEAAPEEAEAAEAPGTAEEAETAEEAPAKPKKVLDFDAMRAVYDEDKVVLTIDGTDITWGDYYSLFYLYARDAANNFDMMKAYYGMDQSWDDVFDQSTGMTYADYVAYGAEQEIAQMVLYENYAAEKGAVLSDEAKADIEAGVLETAKKVLGEDATAEDYVASLSEFYVSPEMYYRMMNTNYLAEETMTAEFGEIGEKMTSEEVVAELEENSFMTAKHILFMTVDRETGETVDEDTARAAKAKAEEIVRELQAIEDDAERKAKFDEYEAEYNDDPGREIFTDGYTFVPGTMYPEFEAATEALGDWEVSDIVESTSGYHVIMRLPLSEESLILYDGNCYPARTMSAGTAYAKELQAYHDGMVTTYAEDFAAPNPKDFMVLAEEAAE